MRAKSLKSSQILRAHMPYFRRPGHICLVLFLHITISSYILSSRTSLYIMVCLHLSVHGHRNLGEQEETAKSLMPTFSARVKSTNTQSQVTQ